MYKLQINELTPGRKYYVKVRAKSPNYVTSEWSPVFEFEAEQDQIPPERVRNLTFISEGDSFIAKWDAPELNMDGTKCTDLSHYNIVLINADASVTTKLQTSVPEFNLDFNRNSQLFGSPSHIIEITVTAVDRVGNEGPGSSKIAQNPPPNKVENVTAQSGIESVTVGWTLGTETDLAAYRIYVSDDANFTPSAATFRGEVASGTDSFVYNTSSLVTQYFRVVAVDKFGATSVPSDTASARPKLTTDYDKTPPGRVLDFTVTQSLASDNNSAVATVTYSSLADTDLDKYELQYRKTGDTVAPWSFANVPSDQTTAEIKPLPLSTDYDFRIRAVDFNANKGVWSAVVVAEGVKKTSLPGAPTDIVASGGATNLMVTWTESTDESMASWAGTYEVQISKTSDFNSSITIKTASTLASFTGLEPNTIYYARARSIDPYGNVGPWSEVADGNTGIVTDPNAPQIYWSDLPPEGGKKNDLWIQLPQNIQHRFDGTDWVEAQDLNLIDKIDAVMQSSDSKNRNVYSEQDASGTTLGEYSFIDGDTWYKRDSSNTILSMWEFRNGGWVIKTLNDTVISNLDAGKITSGYINAGRIDADTITGEMIASKTIVVGNMAEGSVDQTVIQDGAIVTDKIAANAIVATKIDAGAVTAEKILAKEINGEHLATNTAIVNNLQVQSSVTINGINGHIKSDNYTANGNAGFYMDQQQLIINQGKISAAALQIQDSQNILPPVFAGLNYKSKYYENSLSSDNGATFQHLPNAGRNANGAIFHVGRHTRVLLTSGDMTGYFALTAGEKYIVSGYARALTMLSSGTVSPINVSLGVFAGNLYNEDSVEVNGSPKVVTDTFTPQRVQMVFTASFDGLGAIYLNQHGAENNGPLGPEDGVLWSGLQVERVVAGNEVASPWSPPGHTMIDGESITTGAISSNSTIPTPNGNIARWSIDTAGKARFADATIDGKLIVGADVSNKEATSIQSDTYSAGIAGWAIKGNGDVEFNNGTFRGTLSLERAGVNDIDLSMTAAVREIKLYVNKEDYRTISAASIQGKTYAFDREEGENTGIYLPESPNIDKPGTYYIGPTTDRSIKIQVLEGSEPGSVYLDQPPVDTAFTSLNIGEVTRPSQQPLDRENQGLSYDSIRVEADPNNPNRTSVTSVSQNSSVQLRSPHYPETSDGREYPESSHTLSSVIDFNAPQNKNLINASYSLPDNNAPGMTTRRGRRDYDGRAYPLYFEFGDNYSVTLPIISSLKLGRKYIFSVYIDTLDALGPAEFEALLGTAYMKPLPNDSYEVSGNKIVVGAGSESVRISFEIIATRVQEPDILLRSNTILYNSPVYGFKSQLEEAAYQSDMSLTPEIRERTAPTPWTMNGARSSSSAVLSLRAEPSPDHNTWASSSVVGYQQYTAGSQINHDRKLPASMELHLGSAYSHQSVGSTTTNADAVYKWGTAGVVYPGSKSAYLPAAADIFWDFTQDGTATKPTIGGSSAVTRIINGGAWGAINLQGGVYLSDNFNRTSFGRNWAVRGAPSMKLSSDNVNINQNYDLFEKNRPQHFVYHVEPLSTIDRQMMLVRVRNYRFGVFNTSIRTVNVSAILNYNPNTDEGLYLRIISPNISTSGGQTWKLYSVKGASENLIASGSYSHNWNSNDWQDLIFQRDGNTVKCFYAGSMIFDRTFTAAQLPDGKHVGFNLDTGRLDNFAAADNIASSTAYGRLETQSFNVNNNKGIDVSANGTVKIANPGFYMVTADVTGTFNGAANESYWLYIDESVPGVGNYRHNLGGGPGWAALSVSATSVAYLQGQLSLVMTTNSATSRNISRVNWTIVRVA